MSKTASQIISRVKVNIGNRASGNIGGTPVDDVILDSLNTVLLKLAKRDDIPCYACEAQVDIVVGSVYYAMPTLDTSGNTIRVKSIENITCRQVDSIATWQLVHLNPVRFYELYTLRDSSLVARPTYYTFRDIAQGFTLNCFPNVAITAKLQCTSWPVSITVNQNCPFPDEFLECIQAFTTSDIFMSLQLSEDSNIWLDRAEKYLHETLYAIRMQPDYSPTPSPSRRSSGGSTAWPGTDPNVRYM